MTASTVEFRSGKNFLAGVNVKTKRAGISRLSLWNCLLRRAGRGTRWRATCAGSTAAAGTCGSRATRAARRDDAGLTGEVLIVSRLIDVFDVARSEANLQVLETFVAANDWISFLAKDKVTRSNTSVCLTLSATEEQVKKMVKLLDSEGVAYDIGAYKDAPAGLRIWCGATVETADLQALMPWLTWAYEQVTK